MVKSVKNTKEAKNKKCLILEAQLLFNPNVLKGALAPLHV